MMAKSLVRNRHAVTKMYGLKSQLQAVSLRIQVRHVYCRALAQGATLVVSRRAWAPSSFADAEVHAGHGGRHARRDQGGQGGQGEREGS